MSAPATRSGAGAAAPAAQPLSEQSLRRIDREIAKYPPEQRQSAVLAALAIAQEQIGWLPPAVMEEVAAYLRMAPVAVFEVASFYHMFHLAPVGRSKITVCTNLPCALSGAHSAVRTLHEKLGIGLGETTADGCFTLAEGECLGACGDAPVMLVNNTQMHGFMDEAKIDELLASLRKEERK